MLILSRDLTLVPAQSREGDVMDFVEFIKIAGSVGAGALSAALVGWLVYYYVTKLGPESAKLHAGTLESVTAKFANGIETISTKNADSLGKIVEQHAATVSQILNTHERTQKLERESRERWQGELMGRLETMHRESVTNHAWTRLDHRQLRHGVVDIAHALGMRNVVEKLHQEQEDQDEMERQVKIEEERAT